VLCETETDEWYTQLSGVLSQKALTLQGLDVVPLRRHSDSWISGNVRGTIGHAGVGGLVGVVPGLTPSFPVLGRFTVKSAAARAHAQ